MAEIKWRTFPWRAETYGSGGIQGWERNNLVPRFPGSLGARCGRTKNETFDWLISNLPRRATGIWISFYRGDKVTWLIWWDTVLGVEPGNIGTRHPTAMNWGLTISLPRVISFKFPLQPDILINKSTLSARNALSTGLRTFVSTHMFRDWMRSTSQLRDSPIQFILVHWLIIYSQLSRADTRLHQTVWRTWLFIAAQFALTWQTPEENTRRLLRRYRYKHTENV